MYYTNDANMNVTAVVDTDGDVVERYSYDPYGRVTVRHGVIDSAGNDTSADEWDERTSNTFENNILYAGYLYDDETALFHVRHRTYHPTLGRWLQRDPLGYVDGMSLYEYVAGTPVLHLDPYGLQEWKWVSAEGSDIEEGSDGVEVEAFTQRFLGLFMPRRAMLGYAAESTAGLENDSEHVSVSAELAGTFDRHQSVARLLAKGWTTDRISISEAQRWQIDPETGVISAAAWPGANPTAGNKSSDGPLSGSVKITSATVVRVSARRKRLIVDVEINLNVGGTISENVGLGAAGRGVNIGQTWTITHQGGSHHGPWKATYVFEACCGEEEEQQDD